MTTAIEHTDEENKALAKFVASATRLPTLPGVVQRILRMVNDPDVNLAELENVMQADQTMSFRLLKLANSVFYGMSRNVTTVRQAVVVLGLKTVRSMVLTIWTQSCTDRARSPLEVQLQKQMFLHGLSVAVLSSRIGSKVSIGLEEDCFVGGLLHDIGRVALISEDAEGYKAQIADPVEAGAGSPEELERQVWGFDHSELGGQLIETYHLPAFLARAVSGHHGSKLNIKDDPIQAAVALGNSLAADMHVSVIKHMTAEVYTDAREHFGLLDDEQYLAFMQDCRERINSILAELA